MANTQVLAMTQRQENRQKRTPAIFFRNATDSICWVACRRSIQLICRGFPQTFGFLLPRTHGFRCGICTRGSADFADRTRSTDLWISLWIAKFVEFNAETVFAIFSEA
jgi:hypothetical protein